MTVPKRPGTPRQPITNHYFGRAIVDPYQWLEDGNSPETQQWVRDQLAYTRAVLDALPGRNELHDRLEQLLQIGGLGETAVGGEFFFHTRRDGTQNQPVLYFRRGVDGADEVLLDVNLLSSDGTVALDWWQPSHDGKYVAYGTSESGSEMSTLHIIETVTRGLLPDTIERTRAASIAWTPDNGGFYYTRYPQPGDVAAGQEMYNRHVFYHALGDIPANDAYVFGEDRDPEDWPSVALSDDGRWLAIVVSQGWTKSEVFLKDTTSDPHPIPVAIGKDFLYSAEPYDGNLYVVTNEDAPRYRVFKAPPTPAREHWCEIIPQIRRCTAQSCTSSVARLFAKYEHNAHSQLKRFTIEGDPLGEIALPSSGNGFVRRPANTTATARFICSSRSPFRRRSIASICARKVPQCGTRSRPASTLRNTRRSRSGSPQRTEHASQCSSSCATALSVVAAIPRC